MTNQDIANHLIGKTATEIASICDGVFEIVLNETPEREHAAIESELNNVGIMVGHDVGTVANQVGICKKKSPSN